MIYLDNAATSGFKPQRVIDSVLYAVKYLNANAGRSGHKLSYLASSEIYATRKALNEYFNGFSVERVIFTQNCTAALNLATIGTLKEGDEVITTENEHNSVLRPLYHLAKEGKIKLKFARSDFQSVSAKDVEKVLTDKTAMVIVGGASNVTGCENDIDGIGELLRNTKTVFAVDGAQSAGHIKTDMQKQNIDILCIAGHKGLYSVQGVGALLFSPKVDPRPLSFGGTGIDTFNENMPDAYPEALEAGTLNLPAIISLKEGLRYLCDNDEFIARKISDLSEYLTELLSSRPYIKLYSIPNACGIAAFSHAEIPSQELASVLSEKYDICVRGGFHCAPLMHKKLKTEKWGLVRVSLFHFNTKKEISSLINALDEISLCSR